MRLLFATGTSARYMAPPSLAVEQINCGPDWFDHDLGGYITSLNTPVGEYDLGLIAARLPKAQQPDAVVCLVDAAWRSMPRNLQAFRCPKILLVADTHHLNSPISGMIRYAQSEPFDRIILLYDRHHAGFFHAAGIRQVYWFPGLTFPHSDATVAGARAATRENRIAFVGTTGICHPRRTQLLTHLNASGLPLVIKSVGQREGLAFYGESLVGFNAALNGDLNLRVFEILASGAVLLTDQLAPGAGLDCLRDSGARFLTYASKEELAERAQHALSHPPETREWGNAAAQWFDANYRLEKRREWFWRTVSDGWERPGFELPKSSSFTATPTGASLASRLTAGYEYLQELHRNLGGVELWLDESVPTEFETMCATLPRVRVTRGALTRSSRCDLLVIGPKNQGSPFLALAKHVWAWNCSDTDRAALARRCASMGLTPLKGSVAMFTRERANTHAKYGAQALVRLEIGAYEEALALAQEELAKTPSSVDALIVITEIAQATGRPMIAQKAVAQLRALAPHDPRVREVLALTYEQSQQRRTNRLLRIARSAFEQQQWDKALKAAEAALAKESKASEAHFVIGSVLRRGQNLEKASYHLAMATVLAPHNAEYWYELGQQYRACDRTADALGAHLQAAILEPGEFEFQLALGDAAMAAGHGAIACEAIEAARDLKPGHPMVERWAADARRLAAGCDYARPRDLLLSHVEVTRLQGTGVLLERFFPVSDDFVTIRSRTLYEGRVDFGGVHFSLDLPGLDEQARHEVLRRIIGPYKIRRILCVPFYATDFIHGIAARAITGAPLCTYAMDDQVIYSDAVPQELARRLFACSDLRLAISPEMVEEYSAWFDCSFGLLPPIIVNGQHEKPNRWSPALRPDHHCAMVGNIWSAGQFDQLRKFCRMAGLMVDWYGNAKVAWLPQGEAELERDGIFCKGFLPEAELADKLATYPFVVIPSGVLDGSEGNEWLTRLSLPSRMVFIVTKTCTPMLILGNARTAAARFVHRFGLGTSSNYDATEAIERIRELTTPSTRTRLVDNARLIGPKFLVPDCGEWIWRSLTAGSRETAPFDDLFPDVRSREVNTTSQAAAPTAVQNPDDENVNGQVPAAAACEELLQSLALKLADVAFLDSFLPPDEPRQRVGEDIRGAVRFIRAGLEQLHPSIRLLAAKRMAVISPNNRAVLVAWAELLEEAGDLKLAAEKARKALSLFYDDVYTQTLFLRCGGGVNFHKDASDRFCPHPFENFEIFKDGSVFACNCTQVPFPIGNVYRQTAEEIWSSPQAQAIRASILDGSFRYCSPMTCYRRFNLPKRSEHPEEFARLEQIGVAGARKPKELNLSYDLSCNLSCPSCRTQTIMASAPEREQLAHVRDNIVLPLLANKDAEAVYITGSGDAFGSPHFRGILKTLCAPEYAHIKITLGTNGQLLTPRLWEELKPLHGRFRDITISIDGANPASYERHRRGSTWARLQTAMGILSSARREGVISRLMVNMVVQTDNFLEMRPLLALCKAWAVDGIRFYRIRQWGHVRSELFMASDVANPMHPRHADLLAELAHPAFSDPIVDRYDMYELIERAQAQESLKAERKEKLWSDVIATVIRTAETPANAVRPNPETDELERHRESADTFLRPFVGSEQRRHAVALLGALSHSSCSADIAGARETRVASAAGSGAAAPTIQESPDPRLQPPGLASAKTAPDVYPPVADASAVESQSPAARVARFVRGKTVAVMLHGASIGAFAERAKELAEQPCVWVGVNHFSLLEERLLRPHGAELSVVFCCADNEVRRRLADLRGFMGRPRQKLVVTRPDQYENHKDALRSFSSAIALQSLPRLWPYPNSLTLLLRLLVQADASRIVLFGCDGYLGDDDMSLPTYFESETFIREKRPSGILLDTLLFNAHMPRVLRRWKERLGSSFPEIVNCSPGTLIRCFPVIGYDQAADALAGRPLVTTEPQRLPEIPEPLPRCPHDPAPDLAACFNAGRGGDLKKARDHAFRALRLAPNGLTPFAQRVLQTNLTTITAAYHFLMITGADKPGVEQMRAADLLREMREAWDAIGDQIQGWDQWEEPERVPATGETQPCTSSVLQPV